ncbi:MAG: hypothetical protein CME63_09510 [Halobacteriovoraceae bacterium]|nr:hypothetical protein [Halobacteriovoraceae bacterium]MBC97974.1 hypothetical protein [Halobacteriovoraceae bacterium]|tara:strand:+ start:180707 stop:181522 length:816 start_codon:yes stop_codon:yes gene_type:complete
MKSLFVGVGLRPDHYSYLLEKPKIHSNWFEVITENFLYSEGNPKRILNEISKDYPVSFHGVSLNLGSYEPLDKDYLKRAKLLFDECNPYLISDHLCWTGQSENQLHNLLPLPYTNDTLDHLVARISYYQEYIGREISIENLSAYVDFEGNDFTEWDFLAELSKRSGCKILLDINNIFVNSQNYGFNPLDYLDAIPISQVSEIHLAGHTDMGEFLFDTHSTPVCSQVWKLLKYKWKESLDIPVLIEWDEDIPEFSILEEEVLKAKKIGEELL